MPAIHECSLHAPTELPLVTFFEDTNILRSAYFFVFHTRPNLLGFEPTLLYSYEQSHLFRRLIFRLNS